MTITENSNVKKISLHILTFAIRLLNIVKVAVFTELVCKKLLASLQENSIIDNIANKLSFSLQILETSKFDKKISFHMQVKKAMQSKNGSVFDFMIYPPNDESEVVDNSLLAILKAKIERYSNINKVITAAKFKLVEI